LREAKGSLSAIVEAAERGEATTITKRGRPAAVVVPVEASKRLYGAPPRSLVDLLRAIPCPIDVERDPSAPRGTDL
jgi:antitoxin Phd